MNAGCSTACCEVGLLLQVIVDDGNFLSPKCEFLAEIAAGLLRQYDSGTGKISSLQWNIFSTS